MSDPQIMTAEIAVAQNLEVGESARWIDGALHWVDVPTGRRFAWRQGAAEIETTEHADVVTAVFDAGAGRIGVVTRDSVDVPGEPPIALGITEGRSNDARVDPTGGLWVGTWTPDVEARTARLMRVTTGIAPLLGGLTMSNGIGFIGESAYHVDTFTRTVSRYRLDSAGGISEFSNGTVTEEFVTVADALPDGLTVDADGGVWVALWGGGCARRYDPSGRSTHEVRTPGVSQVSSVALGGADGRTLFLTTAAEEVTEAAAGSVFHTRVEIPGVREHVFTGARSGAAEEENGV